MPYTKRSDCILPDDSEATIWRFFDLPKFLWFLQTSSRYFARADTFEDPYEGMMSDDVAAEVRAINPSDADHFNWINQQIARRRSEVFINCWHLSEHESAAMWKLYSIDRSGIAVRSTLGALIHSLRDYPEDVNIGKVLYGDEARLGAFRDITAFWLHKRRSFEHERELRAFIWRPSNEYPITFEGTPEGPFRTAAMPSVVGGTRGLAVRLDSATLAKEVLVAPNAPSWFVEAIADVSRRYSYGGPVRRSRLYQVAYLDS